MTTSDDAKTTPPTAEWVLSPDMDSVRKSLQGAMDKRKLNHGGLAAKMNVTSSSQFSSFLRGHQLNLRLDSYLRAMDAMGFEVVVREPVLNRFKRRINEFRKEKKGAQAPEAPEGADPERVYPPDEAADAHDAAYWAKLMDEHPDADEGVGPVGVLTDPVLRAGVNKILRDNGIRPK